MRTFFVALPWACVGLGVLLWGLRQYKTAAVMLLLGMATASAYLILVD